MMSSKQFTMIIIITVLTVWASSALAYDTYSGCVQCHGSFLATTYSSLKDGQSMGNLHNLHRSTMLNSDCNACHIGSSRKPVYLNISNGGNGLSADGCSGCHGRAEDNTGIATIGAGLRQHHFNAGETICLECHDDSNPANYTPVGENVKPPFYFTPDASHPNKPNDPCNQTPGKEHFAGSLIGLDNDGDGLYDTDDPDCQAAVVCTDNDGDGYGSNGVSTCPKGTAIDCNDNNAALNPGAVETCDSVDNNCNSQVDEDVRNTYYRDADGDGYGSGTLSTQGCTPPSGYVANNTDCNDNNANERPGQIWYQDADNDGYSSGNMIVQCSRPAGYKISSELTAVSGDCNDNNSSIKPNAVDNTCNGVDENCNGTADEGYAPTNTSCGIGVCAATGQMVCRNGATVNTCTAGTPQTEGPAGSPTCSDSLDNNCDGTADAADAGCVQACVPSAEVCDGVDNDCDGQADEGIPSTPTTCGVGSCSATGTQSCVNGTIVNSCTAGAPSAEVCDGLDSNCNGSVDDGIASTPTTCGVGVCASTGQLVCRNGSTVDTCTAGTPQTEGPVSDQTCIDSLDNDCDGSTDVADLNCIETVPSICIDNDGDGYGSNGVSTCPKVAAVDCDDSNSGINPGAVEVCGNGVDENCDGVDQVCAPTGGPVDYAIEEFRASESVRRGEIVRIRLDIKNENSNRSDPGALLTIYGVQNGKTISITDRQVVFDAAGDRYTRYSFTYQTVTRGSIRWYARLTDRTDPTVVLDRETRTTYVGGTSNEEEHND